HQRLLVGTKRSRTAFSLPLWPDQVVGPFFFLPTGRGRPGPHPPLPYFCDPLESDTYGDSLCIYWKPQGLGTRSPQKTETASHRTPLFPSTLSIAGRCMRVRHGKTIYMFKGMWEMGGKWQIVSVDSTYE